jgi:hypothetical protein
LRHQLAVVPVSSTPESALPCTRVASLPVYLYWAFVGVAVCEEQMVQRLTVGAPRTSNPMRSVTQSPSILLCIEVRIRP